MSFPVASDDVGGDCDAAFSQKTAHLLTSPSPPSSLPQASFAILPSARNPVFSTTRRANTPTRRRRPSSADSAAASSSSNRSSTTTSGAATSTTISGRVNRKAAAASTRSSPRRQRFVVTRVTTADFTTHSMSFITSPDSSFFHPTTTSPFPSTLLS